MARKVTTERKEAAVRDAFDRAARAARGEEVPAFKRRISRKGRSTNQKTVDQYVAVNLSVQGYSVEEIAHALGISVQMVQNDLAGTAKLFRDRAMEGIEEHRGRHLMMLDAAADDCWREWHRSKREHREIVTEGRTGGANGNATTTKRALERKKQQTGDVNYIFAMSKVLERSAKLAGLDKPVEAKVYVEKANAAIDRIGNALVEELHDKDPALLQRLLSIMQDVESGGTAAQEEHAALEHVKEVVEASTT